MAREIEVDPTLPVYSGTTLQNFLTCAYIDQEGRVLFDKLREPRFQYPEIHCTHDFGIASRIALREARDLHHRPLVIESMIVTGDFDPRSIRQIIVLEVGLILHIRRCFLIPAEITDLQAPEFSHDPLPFLEYSPFAVLNSKGI